MEWTDSTVPADAAGATVYLRPLTGSAGVAAVGVLGPDGWAFTLDAADTAGMDAGPWAAQGVATAAGGSTAAWFAGARLEVLPSLLFSGDPGPLDLRSPTEIELEAVRAAIAAVYRAQEYEVGAGRYMGRRLLRADLRWLQQREQALLLRLQVERQGRQQRRVLIEFTP